MTQMWSGRGLVVQAIEEGFHFAGTGPADEGVNIDPRDEGLIQELLSGKSVGSIDLNVGLGRMLPGMYHIKHHHPDGSEFYYVIHGECTIHVDGDDVLARPGTTIYLPPNCVHAIRNDSDGVVDLLYGLSRPEYKDVGLVYDE